MTSLSIESKFPLYLTGIKRILAILALSMSTFLIVLDYSIANVSLPYIAGDLGISANQGTYVITSFAVGNAIILPMTGWLTQRIGAVKLLMFSVLGFVILSWLCGFSSQFGMLIISRFFQGAISGPLVPICQSLLISTNPAKKRTTVISFWSMIIIIAPVIGPVVGGWITYDYVWNWIFYINVPLGLACAAVIWLTLRPFETKIQKIPVDWFGFILLSIAVTSLQIILDKGQQFDWFRSNTILVLSIISLLCFIYLFAWEKFHPHPILNLSLFKIKSYSVSIIYIMIMYSNYFGAIVLVPLWLQDYMNYTSLWAGIAVAPLGIAPIFLSSFTGKLINKYGNLPPLFICCIFFALSCFYSAYFTPNVDIQNIWIARLLMGCGIAFFITPLMALSIQDIPVDKLPSATGFFHFVRSMFGGVGTSVFTTIWERRMSFHHARLSANLTPYTDTFQEYIGSLKGLGMDTSQVLNFTNMQLNDQCAIMGLNDVFYLMGWIFLALILLLPLGRRSKG
ncbi:MAG: DHA2 family efflux MFS transporter permease subunit [Chlamydiae bacterium]|nr:DHA2 family efflux MFS transporter permease subunit [Chlamydiota bacterium]